MSRAGVKPRPWTAEEDAVVRAAYGTRPSREVAAELGRGVRATQQRAVTLGLTAGSMERLPAGPLAAAIRQWALREGLHISDLLSGETIGAWEAPHAVVRGDAADRWCCRMECLWFDVWDFDEPAAVAYFVGPEEIAA